MTNLPTKTGFLPTAYEVPQNGNKYMKLEQGDNTIRILGSAILGYLDWQDKTPVRTPYTPDKRPRPINPARPVKHFWAFPIWNYKKQAVQVMEITQSTIQNALYGLANDEAWGDPTGYDIVIKKNGEGMDTEYQVIARPPKPLTPEIKAEYEKLTINLNNLFTNDDPFSEPAKEEFPPEDVDLPF